MWSIFPISLKLRIIFLAITSLPICDPLPRTAPFLIHWEIQENNLNPSCFQASTNNLGVKLPWDNFHTNIPPPIFDTLVLDQHLLKDFRPSSKNRYTTMRLTYRTAKILATITKMGKWCSKVYSNRI